MRDFILFNDNILYISSTPTIEIHTKELVPNKKYVCRVGGELDEASISTSRINSYISTSTYVVKINNLDLNTINQCSTPIEVVLEVIPR